MEPLELFAIQNKEGQWFRRKGYGGYGPSWVDDFKLARIYTNPRGARGQISYFASKWPEYGTPDLVVLRITEIAVLDESKRIEEAKKKLATKEEKRQVKLSRARLDRARKEFEEAQANLKRAEQDYA